MKTVSTEKIFRPTRRGITAVLAMFYVTLFGALALGFFAAVNTAVTISSNDEKMNRAMVAAESGMQFVRAQMVTLSIPYGTPQSQLLSTVWTQLQGKLNGTGNMGGSDPTKLVDGSGVSTIYVPGITAGTQSWMSLDNSGLAMQATIQESGTNFVVTVTGKSGGTSPIQRRIQMTYSIAQNTGYIFNYGIASRGRVVMNGSASVTGSIMSGTAVAAPLTMTGTPAISGDFSYCSPPSAPSYGAGRIAGNTQTSSQFMDHVHPGISPPEFPVVDSSAFAAFVPAAGTSGPSVVQTATPAIKNFSNIRIKANSNPTFSNTTFKGVVYVETPNKITFSGNTTLQGVIVVQNSPTGTYTTNTMTFGGNVTVSGVETLSQATYGALTAMKGGTLLAPTFAASFTGTVSGTSGSILTDKASFTGNFIPTVKGSIITLQDVDTVIGGTTNMNITGVAGSGQPTGVFFGNHYSPIPSSYTEVQ